ncbi:MAG: lipoyl(octanoyl) transferase LipB [Elainellaceae cyanobacterium]
MQKRQCQVYCPGLVDYETAWAWQRSLVAARRTQPDLKDMLLLLEHPPVYTLGQGASLDFVKVAPSECNIPIHRIERGGEVTHHAPGQIVGYPILNLRYYRQDLHWYLRQLEDIIIQVLADYGLQGERIEGLTGVWVKGHKVAAIGIKVSRWITMHGFALNVCPDMTGFQNIVPCGIGDRPVGRLVDFAPDIDLLRVQAALLKAFAEIFNLEMSLVTHLNL